jgi:2-polyprenyl-6-methoxyphenol hydroxylase-like FAD-dependent oxidoreductase/mannose-6-phosphate isomerase-like protein (cupin superfamily)
VTSHGSPATPVREPILVVGGGIGGLATALALHRRGLECRVFEQSSQIRELGVGINTLPHAIGELSELGLLDRLDAVAVRTYELIYMNCFGQEVWRELRGLDAGHPVPQFSIHRGVLQAVLKDAVIERLGPDAISTGRRLVGFEQDDDGVTARFADTGTVSVETVVGSALVGADGIHSTVRSTLVPGEPPPRWNGTMLWRGATDWRAFLTSRSMIIAGGMEAKVVVYPIGAGSTGAHRLTNWAVMARVGTEGTPPPRREDWSRPGHLDEVLPHVGRFSIGEVDVPSLIQSTPVFWEYPVCDRDPLDAWSRGRVTLLGDAAHAMYPVGSNGASQAILDATALAEALAGTRDVTHALRRYDVARRGPTAEIVYSNRTGGPEGVIDAVQALAPEGFDDVEAVLSHSEREAIVRGYAQKAGFAVPAREQSTTRRRPRMNPSTGPDVVSAGASIDGIEWNILGQIYRPKQLSECSFAWHATFPPDTFVPPHIHPTQDEYVYVLDGELTLADGGADRVAGPGDLLRMPMGQPHGLFNRSGANVVCLFWVTPTGRLYDLFVAIDAMAEQTPDAVVALAADHEVEFLPPPAA